MADSLIKDRLQELRKVMKSRNLQAWIVPNSDPHLSEYINDYFANLKYLSGFTGSAGTLVVTETKAVLFTDSRYWEQAEKQLSGSGIELFKQQFAFPKEFEKWSKEHISKDSTVGICAGLISKTEKLELEKTCERSALSFTAINDDIGDLRGAAKPKLQHNKIIFHSQSPRSAADKLSALKAQIQKAGADSLLIGKLDNIAWLTNLRGSDIPCNPIFFSYALVNVISPSYLFADPFALELEALDALEEAGFLVLPYDEAANTLQNLPLERVMVDPNEVNYALLSSLPDGVELVEQTDPIERMKAEKTPEEIALIKEAMEKDGVALVKFQAWLETEIQKGSRLNEINVAEKLLDFRKEQKNFIEPSFDTICAFGPNAALPHYKATDESFSEIGKDSFLLIDSGGQYLEGTTDITRTYLIGEATKQMMLDYTAVLRAHIRLAMAKFPEFISSQSIDAIARAPLWDEFADYGHGTGHGVGFFLNVHEGPQRISYPRVSENHDAVVSRETRMSAGMVTSDEPGLYRAGKYGIRIENLLANVFAGQSEFGRFLGFETLTLCPIDLKPVITERLLEDEKAWINNYHAAVFTLLSKRLDDKDTLEWLRTHTLEIS